jgi:hydrogenase maturation protease
MNHPVLLAPGRHRHVRRAALQATAPAARVEVLVCGSRDRGDDGAAVLAMALLVGGFPEDVGVRFVGQLDIEDLLAVPDRAAIVIVDTAVGIPPGQIVDLPLSGLVGRGNGIRPRSSHAIGVSDVVALAGLLRGEALHGRAVAIGGITFGLGEGLSWPVAAAIPELRLAIVAAVDRERARAKAV